MKMCTHIHLKKTRGTLSKVCREILRNIYVIKTDPVCRDKLIAVI